MHLHQTESGCDSQEKHPAWCLHGAGVLVFDNTARVLVVQRRDNQLFELPCGGVEEGENPRRTAHRELLSETGLDIPEQHLALVGIFAQLAVERDENRKIIRDATGNPICHEGTFSLFASEMILRSNEEFKPQPTEVLSVHLMSLRVIWEHRRIFTLAAKRLIFAFHNAKAQGQLTMPMRGSLRDTVEYLGERI